MPGLSTRYLYLTRHGEASPGEGGLTESGRRQARLLGERLRDIPLAREASELFTGPVTGDLPSHQLVVTHSFLIAWLVRDALDAPKWRWLTLAHCNAALTVIRYPPGQPASVLFYNDMTHLPDHLRWTGFPPELSGVG